MHETRSMLVGLAGILIGARLAGRLVTRLSMPAEASAIMLMAP